jgi:hypothetical protein
MKERQVIVDRFKQSKRDFIFLISTKAGVHTLLPSSPLLLSTFSLCACIVRCALNRAWDST